MMRVDSLRAWIRVRGAEDRWILIVEKTENDHNYA